MKWLKVLGILLAIGVAASAGAGTCLWRGSNALKSTAVAFLEASQRQDEQAASAFLGPGFQFMYGMTLPEYWIVSGLNEYESVRWTEFFVSTTGGRLTGMVRNRTGGEQQLWVTFLRGGGQLHISQFLMQAAARGRPQPNAAEAQTLLSNALRQLADAAARSDFASLHARLAIAFRKSITAPVLAAHFQAPANEPPIDWEKCVASAGNGPVEVGYESGGLLQLQHIADTAPKPTKIRILFNFEEEEWRVANIKVTND